MVSVWGASLCAMFALGFAHSSAAADTKTTDPVAGVPDGQAAGSDLYVLEPGDLLTVNVWKEADLTADVLIRPDGGISFPLAGQMHAAGLTITQLTALLQTKIRKFVPDAVVTVTTKTINGNVFYVVGKVNKPGMFPLFGPTDVTQALAVAAGATPFADTNSIRILRRDGDHQIAITYRYGDIEGGRRLEQNILLQSGDTVVVP
jgi:polysaccharide export outer membrane protein